MRLNSRGADFTAVTKASSKGSSLTAALELAQGQCRLLLFSCYVLLVTRVTLLRGRGGSYPEGGCVRVCGDEGVNPWGLCV